ncbi:MAG TPA: ankyrin repeat domain-containing protein [Gammaproteobacteria bacterium]|nr:ankyrin repeat domain-containing protein [Gammaproteobacteria bacterium]
MILRQMVDVHQTQSSITESYLIQAAQSNLALRLVATATALWMLELQQAQKRIVEASKAELLLQAELRQAAFDGDLQTVKRLHKEFKVQINAAGPESKRTALHRAAENAHAHIVSYLLKAADAWVDPMDCDGNTPLNLVAQPSGHPLTKKIAVMELLLNQGADCTIANRYQLTPLMNLVPLRNKIITSYSNLREGLNNVIRKMKKSIYERADKFNQGVLVHDSGEIVFDRTKERTVMPRFESDTAVALMRI